MKPAVITAPLDAVRFPTWCEACGARAPFRPRECKCGGTAWLAGLSTSGWIAERGTRAVGLLALVWWEPRHA